jgi:hypothetical protein
MEILNPGWPALSPLFHYHVTRYDKGGANEDGFLFLDQGLISLSSSGICTKALHPHPYTMEGASTKPSKDAYDDALTRALGRRGVKFRYLPMSGPSNVSWIREQLNQNRPVVVGMQLPMGYPSSFLDTQFQWHDPDDQQRSRSGHCVLVVGYNDARQAVHIQDCRGSNDFDQGFWWMGYRVLDSSFVLDAYSIIP